MKVADFDELPGRTPHDRLFHLVFRDPAVAREELQAVLPPALLAQLDMSTLVRVEGRTVSRRLRNLAADMLYRVKLGADDVYLWILLEHQSTADPLIAFRLLQYEVEGWAAHLRSEAGAKRGRLPVVIPVVLLHDAAGRRPPARLLDLYDAPASVRSLVRPLLPDFTYLVDDLMAVDEVDIERRSESAVYRLALWLLRSRGKGEEDRFEAYREAFRALAEGERRAYALAFLMYAMAMRPEEDPLPLRAADAADAGFKEEIVSIWEQRFEEAEQRGLQRGRDEGQQQGRVAMFLEVLELKFGPLSPEATARVHGASSAELHRWAARALAAETVAEVFADA